MIVRRNAIATVIAGLSAGIRPGALPAWAQMSARPVIGFLGSETPEEWADRLAAFRTGLREAGREEGRNVTIEYRWAGGRFDRLPALAAELVAQRVDLIAVLGNTTSAVMARAATSTIPIVFRMAGDPVAVGLVASMNRPGGNVTGVTTLGVEVGPKQLELLRELVPGIRTVAILLNPTNAALSRTLEESLPRAAQTLGIRAALLTASRDDDFEPLFSGLVARRVDALLITADTFFNSRSPRLAQLAARHALPTVSPYREFAAAGGLMSYGGSISDASRIAGSYAARILNGERPAELPVHQASRIDLTLNLKAAKAIGIEVSEAFLSRVDEVIE